ncbi:hypothetical protein [Streptomyces sp. NPDC007205]|uniref:hypothetical protein n=1 Tax=Streptomyces sp. NPDC007205 TaxID=3154316 RepID=UPI0033DDB5C2
MPASDFVPRSFPALYDRFDSFVQARLEEARSGVPAGSEAARAPDALQYLAGRAACAGDLLRTGVRVHPDQAVREARADEAGETLRHIARRWHEHPDYAPSTRRPGGTRPWRRTGV